MMFNEIALPVIASLSSISIHAENTIGTSAPLMGYTKPGPSIDILLFSLVISLSLAVWYAVYYDSITNVNHGVNRSQYHDYSRLARGVNGMGIYFLLSIIPYFGWIFMLSSEISAARIRRQATKLGGGGFHPSRLYSVMAFFTGIGLLIYSFIYASTGFFHVGNGSNVIVDYWSGILTLGGYSTTNSNYVQMWFLAMAAAAFTSIAAGSRHNITIPFMIIFILVLLTSFLNVEYGFFSMMGILFLFSITSRISLRHARYVYLKSGGKTVSTTGSVQAPDSQPQSQPQAQSAQGSSGKTRVIKLSDYENTFVLSGPPSSGKTTFLSYLYKFMPEGNWKNLLHSLKEDMLTGVTVLWESMYSRSSWEIPWLFVTSWWPFFIPLSIHP